MKRGKTMTYPPLTRSKIYTATTFLLAITSQPGFAAQDVIATEEFNIAGTGTLILEITNIKKQTGQLRIAVFHEEGHWLKNAFSSTVIDVQNDGCAATKCMWITTLPTNLNNKYAVAIYHDADDNQSLDTNLLGIPTEQYGFSNNQSAMFGAPDWESASFELNGKETTHSIQLR